MKPHTNQLYKKIITWQTLHTTKINRPRQNQLQTEISILLNKNQLTTTQIEQLTIQQKYYLCVSLPFLLHTNPTFFGGTMLAQLVKLLISHEQQPGGPYIFEAEQSRPNFLVNLQIYIFFKRQNVSLPKLQQFITNQLDQSQDRFNQITTEKLLYQLEHNQQLPIIQPPISYSLTIPGAQKKTTWQSTILDQVILNLTKHSVAVKHNTHQSAQLLSLQARFTSAGTLIAQHAQKYLTEISTSNSNKLILHSASLFSKELHAPQATTVQLDSLDKATSFGWIAYTVFDHIWDREGREDELAVGTISLRESYWLFRQAINTTSWHQLVDQTFDSIDAGFTWEMCSARFDINQPISNIQFPQYQQLEQQFVQRSIGLSLPLLALLDHQPAKVYEAASKYYYYFIAVKQINDDAHDWREDLMTGKINLVNWHLLTALKQNHTQSQFSINQLADQELLAKIIWEDIIPLTMSAAIDYYAQAQEHLETLQPYMQTSLLNSIIDKQRQIAQHTLDQRQSAKDFLKSYTL